MADQKREKFYLYSKIVVLFTLTLVLTQTPPTDGAHILAAYIMPAKSHYMMHRALISELLKQGHQITMIAALTLEPQNLGENYTEILIEPVFDYWSLVRNVTGKTSIYDMSNDCMTLAKLQSLVGLGATEHALKQPNVQAIINANQTHGVYDLLLVEQYFQDAFLALAHVYNVPVISTATFAQQNFMSQMFGIITPWSYVPIGTLPLTERMNYWERVANTLFSFARDMSGELMLFPQMDALVKKYFGHLAIDFPSISDMNRNLSAMLINSHTPLAVAVPKASNMINVGGIHIYPNKPLPYDVEKFIDEALHGVIYFSLGSQVQSKDLPHDKIQVFLDVFRKLKQRVLWKYENTSLANVPANVMIKSWMPQNDILAHPNVRAFIAHGGLFGTQEAVYYGVPMIGIPFFSDQNLNVKKGDFGGYIVPLDIHTLTRRNLKQAINEVLYNTTYRNTMKRMSQIFRDRPMGPRETAMYWIDYVIRHKGARHLRPAGLDLKWYQLYLLDVIALFVGAAAVAFGVVLASCFWAWRIFKLGKIKQKMQ